MISLVPPYVRCARASTKAQVLVHHLALQIGCPVFGHRRGFDIELHVVVDDRV
jgi:hypothetical protein